MRLVAGLEAATAGTLQIDQRPVDGLRPDTRIMFQDARLLPWKRVIDNVALGLAQSDHAEAAKVLDQVGLADRGNEWPARLSGGQRQRVALARALVNRPRVLLLDEPLGALDLKLREQMQVELKAIQRDVGITFVFVTHDQDEALTMSDRIAVFNNGRIEQIGSPADVYERPATEFVAGFVGTSNLLRGESAQSIIGRPGVFSIRPEKIRLVAESDGIDADEHSAVGVVREVVYVGDATRFVVGLDAGAELVALRQNLETSSMQVNEYRDRRIKLVWRREHEFQIG